MIARLIKAKETRGNGGSCCQTLFNVASIFVWTHMMVKMFSFRSPYCFSHHHEVVENGWTWDILSTFSTSKIILKGSFISIHFPAFYETSPSKVYGANLPKAEFKMVEIPIWKLEKMIDPWNLHHTSLTPGVWCYAFVQIKDCEHLGMEGRTRK